MRGMSGSRGGGAAARWDRSRLSPNPRNPTRTILPFHGAEFGIQLHLMCLDREAALLLWKSSSSDLAPTSLPPRSTEQY